MFEWYVLNYDINRKKVINFNIFRNWLLEERVIDLCRDYDGDFDKFVHELDRAVMWQEWARTEYEILVGNEFGGGKFEKWDCYSQVKPNMKILAQYVLTEWEKHKGE